MRSCCSARPWGSSRSARAVRPAAASARAVHVKGEQFGWRVGARNPSSLSGGRRPCASRSTEQQVRSAPAALAPPALERQSRARSGRARRGHRAIRQHQWKAGASSDGRTQCRLMGCSVKSSRPNLKYEIPNASSTGTASSALGRKGACRLSIRKRPNPSVKRTGLRPAAYLAR